MVKHVHKIKKPIAHVVDVNMGYGHSRAAHALKDLNGGVVLSANAYEGIPNEEKALWKNWRQAYESLSRLRPIPIVGKVAFSLVEKVQEIPDFYPKRDLSSVTIALRQAYYLIDKQGLGKHLTETLNKNPLPVVCTHPIPAFALEAHGYLGDIWCVPTDTDVARAWVSWDAKKSRIRYFCANGRLVERLKLYGLRESQLFLTGFPLPKELIGGPNSSVLIQKLFSRLCNLDPNRIFLDRYKKTIAGKLGRSNCVYRKTHPLTLSYAVGGAGAQRAIGRQLLESLKLKIKRDKLHIHLIAGTRPDVLRFFEDAVKKAGLSSHLGKQIHILFDENRSKYFARFNKILLKTDILWTKPSELAFFTALGIPIIMAPPLGRQEIFNAAWLSYVGGGVPQADPKYADEWLFDWLNSGGLARAAWNGFVEAPTFGVYRIEDILRGKKPELMPLPLIV